MAGLTYWDVPNLETLHQVSLPSGKAPFPPPPRSPPRPRLGSHLGMQALKQAGPIAPPSRC